MTSDSAKAARDILNASGFLFQLRVRHEIEASEDRHGWKVVGWEQPWLDGDSTRFVDMVLQRCETRLVVECKRQRDGHWVFPVPHNAGLKRHIRALEIGAGPMVGQVDVRWADLSPAPVPSSHEPEFCAVRGQDDFRRTPMLEREAQVILGATDATGLDLIARVRELWAFYGDLADRGGARPKTHRAVPVIVTNARLTVAKIAVESLPLDAVVEADSEAEFEDVGIVRFRKNLVLAGESQFPAAEAATDPRRSGERTILVVRADALLYFLKATDL